MTRHEEALLREKFPEEEAFAAAALRLEHHEPLAYILGEWYFWRQTYLVNPDVLIPRADTELLVERLAKILPHGARFLDLCTGSGCIAISTLCERPDVTALAVDLSQGALAVARENAKKCGVNDRCTFACADVTDPAALSALAEEGAFDVIVSNPPYIDTDVIPSLSPEVRSEPRMALDGGIDGMDFYRAILKHARPLLREGGIFLFEIGYDQREKITALSAPLKCTVTCDYGGNPRCAMIELPAAVTEASAL